MIHALPFKHVACKGWPQVVPVLLPLVAAAMLLAGYLAPGLTNLAMAALAIGVHTDVRRKGTSGRFAGTAAVFGALCWFVPVNSLLYFGLAFLALFAVECRIGRVGFAGVVALLLSAPLFESAATVFSFSIRLRLAEWTGKIFSLLGSGITIRGNTIRDGAYEFAVDPACMGLRMLSLSLLLGIVLVGLIQRKEEKVLPVGITVLLLLLLFGLNLFSNLLRIVLLVQFRLLPETLGHDLVGLACLLIYVVVPGAFLARFFVRRRGRTPSASSRFRSPSWIYWPLLVFVLAAGWRVGNVDTYAGFRHEGSRQVDGYRLSTYAPGILKLEDSGSLVYVKYARGFYDTEHNPSICWRGGGYEFRQLQVETLGSREVYSAELVNGKEVLFTAWWYENGRDATVSQWTWRKEMLFGAPPFALVNVTATSRAAVQEAIINLRKKRVLQDLFQQRARSEHGKNETNNPAS